MVAVATVGAGLAGSEVGTLTKSPYPPLPKSLDPARWPFKEHPTSSYNICTVSTVISIILDSVSDSDSDSRLILILSVAARVRSVAVP